MITLSALSQAIELIHSSLKANRVERELVQTVQAVALQRVNADLAIRFKQPPQLVANLKDLKQHDFIDEVVCDGNYLNITFDFAKITEIVCTLIESEGPRYGKKSLNGRKVVIEHTSITPAYPINVTTFRSSVIGNALYTLFLWAGYDAKSHFWLHDGPSRHLEASGKGLLACGLSPETARGKSDHTIGAAFLRGAGLIPKSGGGRNEKLTLARRMFPFADPICFSDGPPVSTAGEVPSPSKIAELCLRGYEQTYQMVGIRIDNYDRDSGHNWRGQIERLVEELKRRNLLIYTEKDVRITVNTDEMVLISGPGRPSYLLRSLAYAIARQTNNTHYIGIISERQKRIADTIEYISAQLTEPHQEDRSTFLLYGDVFVDRKPNDSIKAGVFHSVDGLVEQVAAQQRTSPAWIMHCLYFAMLGQTTNKPMHIATSVIQAPLKHFLGMHLEVRRLRAQAQDLEFISLAAQVELRRMLILLWSFPDVITESAEKLRPQRITHLLWQLRQSWSGFLRANATMERTARISLMPRILGSLDQCLCNLWNCMGLEADNLLQLVG